MSKIQVIEARWQEFDKLQLYAGGHEPNHTFCLMEAVAYIAGEPWSDEPTCASPILGTFCRTWNDALDDETRQLLKPYIPRLVGTNTGKKDDETRGWLATDWLVRECAPAFLRCAGLTEHAETLEHLAAVTTAKLAGKAMPALAAASSSACSTANAAVRASAYAAAYAAARAALEPTVKLVQLSAFKLLDRMIEVRK